MDLLALPELFHGIEWDHPLWWFPILLLGLVIGSFLNVVIHRLPIMLEREWQAEARYFLGEDPAEAAASQEAYNLAWPPSQCPKCARPIRLWENIPVVSWLILRARCPGCRGVISWRYPLIELLTALLFLVPS